MGLCTCLLIMKGPVSRFIRTLKKGVNVSLDSRRISKGLVIAAEAADSGSRSQFFSTMLAKDPTLVLKNLTIWVICISVTNN